MRTGDNVTRLVPATAKEAGTEISDGRLSFEDNRIAGLVFGHFDQNLTQIERRLGIVAVANGNEVSLKGPTGAMEQAMRVLGRHRAGARLLGLRRGEPLLLQHVGQYRRGRSWLPAVCACQAIRR